MDIIKQNPYRVLGVLADASERELQKQLSIIKRYSEVGKTKIFETDFNFIGDVSRSAEDVQIAAGRIEQAHKKVHYALFWFVSVNNFDEIAFNNLKKEERGKAIEIWNKTLKEEVSSKNYSSYHNLSTLYIASSLIGEQLDLQLMSRGVALKGKLLKSDLFPSFLELVGGNGVPVDLEIIGSQFVDDIIEIVDPPIGRNVRVKSKRVIELFSGYPNHIKKYLIGKYTELPLSNVESGIRKAGEQLKKNPANSIEYGEILYDSTRGDIAFLKTLLGSNDIQFQMIVDKLADKLMQCSIACFNEWIDTDDIDSGSDILKIADYAKAIEPTGRVKQRMDANLEIMRSRIDDKLHHQQQNEMAEEMEYLALKLREFEEVSVTMITVNELLRLCRPKLETLKDGLGPTDGYYLEISDAVVSYALGGLIDIVNETQNEVVKGVENIDTFKKLIDAVISTIDRIDKLDMSAPIRSRVNKNRKFIATNFLNIPIVIPMGNFNIERAVKKPSGGCYIATMAYGDYDHPQVLTLRRYRDHVLSKTIFGRLFIKLYYATSPYLVKALSNRTEVNAVIRKLLDKWIEVIEA